MSENGILDWLEDAQTISVNVNYDDPTPTPPLKVTPGDADSLTDAAKTNATQLSTKMYGVDTRAALAQWVLLAGYLLDKGILSLTQFESAMGLFEANVNTRMSGVEKRMTIQESAYNNMIKELTDNAGTDGAAELIQARSSTLYGEFGTVDARLEYLESLMGDKIPAGVIVTIPHDLGRNPQITVSYYEYALGTEPEGLGTGPYGLGGSDPKIVENKVQYPDANTAKVTLPANYNLTGEPTQGPDGNWYLTDGYKTLQFKIGDGDGTATDGGDDSGGNTGTPSTGDGMTIYDFRVSPIDDETVEADWRTK